MDHYCWFECSADKSNNIKTQKFKWKNHVPPEPELPFIPFDDFPVQMWNEIDIRNGRKDKLFEREK